MGKIAKLRDIVVLGLLNEQPRYGYEIKMIIDHVMVHFLDVSSGSLYYGIKKLQQSGYIEETTVERVGKRPERSVYKITEPGREHLQEMLPDYIFPRVIPTFPINLALFFFEGLPVMERIRRLKMWQERLVLSNEGIKNILAQQDPKRNRWHLLILKHLISYTEREIPFAEELLNEIPESAGFELSAEDKREVKQIYSKEFANFDYSVYMQHPLGDLESAE